MTAPVPTRRFSTREEAAFRAFLASTPRALVLFRGTTCPYSATLLPHFEKAAPTLPSWTFAVRDLSEAEDGPWDEHGVDVTPTVIAYADGTVVSRLPGKMLLGITRQTFAKWLKGLP